jgi:anti-anti-sigma factor
MPLTITVTEQNGQCNIFVDGDVDERGAEELKRRFQELPHGKLRGVVVDFKGVNHIGSAGIGKFLVLYKDLAVYDASLRLINVPRPIYNLLCEMKLNTIFTIEPIAR